MQTRKDVYDKVKSLVGDPDGDWLDEGYFSGYCNIAYQEAIQYLEETCSPYIEKVVIVPNVTIGGDESNLVPYGVKQGGGQVNTYPLAQLVKPRFVDYKPSGQPNSRYITAREFSVIPDSVTQITTQTFDIRVRGDFLPKPLLADDDVVEVHPNAAHALAYSIGALIGMERPNQGWVQNYGSRAQDAWDQIAADLVRQQQRLTFRLGSPNRNSNRGGFGLGWGWPLQGTVYWEWRSFGLYVKTA